MDLAFDHEIIMRDALTQIQQKMLTTTIAREFLSEEFTMSELYQVIQTVVPTFKERNFIRKITSTQSRKGIIEEVLDHNGQGKHVLTVTPSELLSFTDLPIMCLSCLFTARPLFSILILS